jgi:polysaccharide export outer membrane protein
MKINIFKLSIIVLLSVPLVSQELDTDFLNSLPGDVRADLLEEVQKREDLEAPQYRRPSTFIAKPELNEDESNRFGFEYFSMMQSTLMPLNEPNFDPNYVLDFGDILELQLTGQRNAILDISILRDGSISLPDIGKVIVSGLTLAQASELISNKIASVYIGVDSYVTLKNIRDIQVIISGNAFNPGPYLLNGNSNIFHALTVSGGPSEYGSFRKIDLIRDSKRLETIDLYDLFMHGKSTFSTRLRSGDIIFIHPALKMVSINGAVKREGLYELKDNETGSDLLYYANGITVIADESELRLETISDMKAVSQNIASFLELENKTFNDGDSVWIGNTSFRDVTISGAVKNTGEYRLNQGDGILELVERAGGYLENSYEFGGILISEDALEAATFARDQLYKSFLAEIVDNAIALGESGSMETIGLLLNDLKDSEVSGRVNAEFDIERIKNNQNLNTALKDGDSIIIPEKVNHVYVFGEVQNQGTIPFSEKYTITNYIDNKGGFRETADRSNIFVLHPNGQSIKMSKKNLFRDGDEKIYLYPGSIIFVPKKVRDGYRSKALQSYATILGNLGVSIASISVLKD